MLRRSQPRRQVLAKMCELPGDDFDNTARVLLAVFRAADLRRRAEHLQRRGGRCRHWWHGNIEDQRYVAWVKAGQRGTPPGA